MNLRFSRIHYPVTTLGYGRRLGIWTQGCHIRCAGCINRDTWDPAQGYAADVHALLDMCGDLIDVSDGITISGGEPFEQEGALFELLDTLRTKHRGDILVFSGFERNLLLASRPVEAGLVDVLVSGPYREADGQTLTLRGSDNQRIDLLTPLAHQRYPSDIDRQPWEFPRHMDVFPEDDGVFMAGIPEPGWGAKFRISLEQRGFQCRTSDQSPSS